MVTQGCAAVNPFVYKTTSWESGEGKMKKSQGQPAADPGLKHKETWLLSEIVTRDQRQEQLVKRAVYGDYRL